MINNSDIVYKIFHLKSHRFLKSFSEPLAKCKSSMRDRRKKHVITRRTTVQCPDAEEEDPKRGKDSHLQDKLHAKKEG
jgi:hypothetical protein